MTENCHLKMIDTQGKYPYDWFLGKSTRQISIDPHIKTEMRNHKMLTKLPGDQEPKLNCRCPKESTLDEISNTFQELRIRKSIFRYNTHNTVDNRENTILEAKEAHDPE
ncbi:hypothetical protein O181_053626 [Austropuccinia psidii MF-1]|uniref:Uncharacterized protein n=1 Tax=Austropuccinia psidii MF-1 TaxID=1389203 RepID=A0A9Q3HQD4_9BASI|nr:hypothetical protein [Austropuccinia psidii MF-1]